MWSRRRDEEFDREIRAHLDLESDELVAEGMSPEDARAEARRRFGNMTSVKERFFETRRPLWISQTIQDTGYALRTLHRDQWFAAVVILTLAVGIGANTAVFSVLDATLLRPLPYPDADRLVLIWDSNLDQADQRIGPTPANMLDWRARTRAFDGMAAWYAGDLVTLQAPGEPEKISRANVTADFFALLRREPLLGRTFTAAETAEHAPVVVLSHGLWRRRFGSDPMAVGRPVVLDGIAHDVIGVMPPDFTLPNRDVGVWLPWDFVRGYARRGSVPRDFRFLRVIARLADEVSLPLAQADLDSVAAALAAEYPETNAGWQPRLVTLRDELVGGDVRTAILILFGAVCFVLMIACTNVANLVMSKTADRRRELAVRRAIGAGPSRLARQLLTESVLLAVAGGLLGVFGAWLGLGALTRLAPADLPQLDGMAIDGRILAFSVTVSVATGLLFGSVPAFQGVAGHDAFDLKADHRTGTGRSHQRVRSALVVLQLASALALLVGSGLLIRSFVRLLEVEPGFDAEGVLVVRVFPDEDRYDTSDERLEYFRRLRERVLALPGVTAAGAATGLPLNAFNNTPLSPYWAAERPPRTTGVPEAEVTMVTVGFFQAMRIPLLRGRDFDERDDADAPRVVIINEALADEVWPDGDVVGRRLMLDYGRSGPVAFDVVGVVGSTRALGLKVTPPPAVFMPHAQVPYVTMHLVVRTRGAPSALSDPVRREVLALDPQQPAHGVTTMTALVDEARATDRFAMVLLGLLALLAVGLALCGVYSLLAQAVTRRQREFGIRMALGARLDHIVSLVMREGSILVALGLVAGLAAALGLSRSLSAILYEVSPGDVATYLVSSLLIGLVALAAIYVPACRAGRTSIVETLRAE